MSHLSQLRTPYQSITSISRLQRQQVPLKRDLDVNNQENNPFFYLLGIRSHNNKISIEIAKVKRVPTRIGSLPTLKVKVTLSLKSKYRLRAPKDKKIWQLSLIRGKTTERMDLIIITASSTNQSRFRADLSTRNLKAKVRS